MRDFISPTRGQKGSKWGRFGVGFSGGYFWRWAIWKVLQHSTARGPGLVTYISASSYLFGDAFVGLRELLRRECDDVYVLDLGGDGRGARPEQNIFAIRSPVAIAVALRRAAPDRDTPARVHYHRVRGSRDEKLAALDAIAAIDSVPWIRCPDGWQDRFLPAGIGEYFSWPRLTNLFPWQQSAVKLGRKWCVGPDDATLQERWRRLMQQTTTRAENFVENRTGRKVHETPAYLLDARRHSLSIEDEPADAQFPSTVAYTYRSFDRQRLIADARLMDRASPTLWRAHGDRQIYFGTQLSKMLGVGPALIASALLPDLDFFCNRGAKDTIPLYRDAAAEAPNVAPDALRHLSQARRTRSRLSRSGPR